MEAPILAALTTEIQALYSIELGRVADPSGVATFYTQVVNGAPISTVRQEISQSQEETNDINQLYQQVLGRVADSGGLATYQNQIATNASLADVRSILAFSQEATGDLPAAYKSAYGQNATISPNTLQFLQSELALVTGISATGTTLAAVEASLANPLIIDTVASQAITTPSTDQPFAIVTVLDPMPGSEVATITITNAQGTATDANGKLSGAGLSETSAGSGVYTLVSASATELSTALNNLTFTPTSNGNAVTTNLTLSVKDGAGHPATPVVASITTQTVSTPADPNFIYSSPGAESLTGTTSPDIFAFSTGMPVGNDTVTSFDVSHDMLQFSSSQFGSAQAVLNATQNNVSGSAVIHIDGPDSITLTGVSASSLSSQNIRLV